MLHGWICTSRALRPARIASGCGQAYPAAGKFLGGLMWMWMLDTKRLLPLVLLTFAACGGTAKTGGEESDVAIAADSVDVGTDSATTDAPGTDDANSFFLAIRHDDQSLLP